MSDLARASTPRGDVVLRRRADETVELRVNGVFVMDTRETSSERMLARSTLDAATRGHDEMGLAVLIGGLGLGFTLHEVLADPRVARALVAEIEGDLVDWHRSGVVPSPDPAAPPLADPRVEVVVGDVRDVVSEQTAGSLDVILLDVDNGPNFLVYDANAAVYRDDFLATCATATRPGGTVAIWSADSSAALAEAMQRVFATVEEWPIPVILGTRATTYHLFLGRRSLGTISPGD